MEWKASTKAESESDRQRDGRYAGAKISWHTDRLLGKKSKKERKKGRIERRKSTRKQEEDQLKRSNGWTNGRTKE